MDGLYDYEVQEPIFRQYLQRMDDEELSGMARHYVFLCQTSTGGPWRIDAFKRDLIREEFSHNSLEVHEALGKLDILLKLESNQKDHPSAA